VPFGAPVTAFFVSVPTFFPACSVAVTAFFPVSTVAWPACFIASVTCAVEGKLNPNTAVRHATGIIFFINMVGLHYKTVQAVDQWEDAGTASKT
jgi:hypothetical protein